MTNNMTSKVVFSPSSLAMHDHGGAGGVFLQRAQTSGAGLTTNLQQTNVNHILHELESSLENRSSDLDEYQVPKAHALEPMMIHGTGQKLKPKEITKKLSPISTKVSKKIIYTYEQKQSVGDEPNYRRKKGNHQHKFSNHSGTTHSNVNESSKFVTLEPPATNVECA